NIWARFNAFGGEGGDEMGRCREDFGIRWLVLGSSALGVLLAAGPARATDFTVGGWQGSFDTTVSVGVLNRVEGRNPDLIGRANGGRSPSTNQDNGDLN